jgi:aspartyl-tRNA(Asn)/glutamyl-tRNA(Gln) amidotransferase subunit C
MAISREEVEKVSLLSRLLLSDQELDTMTAQLGQILDYINLLAEVNTDDVQPMAHAVESSDVFRPDVAQPSLDRQEALANAPHQDGECYRVPAVLGVG